MRSILFLVALLGAVSAQNKWPMISVNAAGDIVLQSTTRTQSFIFTPLTVNTGPASPTTANAGSATRLAAGVNVFRVLIPAGVSTGAGVTLPTPVPGQTVTLLQSDTTFSTSYVIYTDTGVFINAESTTQSITVTGPNRRTTCVAVTSSRWDCDSGNSISYPTYSITTTGGTTITGGAAVTGGATITGGTTVSAGLVVNGNGVVSIAPTTTTAAAVSIAPTASTDNGAVTINPTAGGVTITAASTKNIALTTSGAAGVLSLTSAAGGISLTPGAGTVKIVSASHTAAAADAAGTRLFVGGLIRVLCATYTVATTTWQVGVCANDACTTCTLLA